jgi:hypothetical protein
MDYDTFFRDLFDRAQVAGFKAGTSCVPCPVTFITANNFDDVVAGGEEFYESEGDCGCAWAVIRPGNCKFANWLKRNDLGDYDSYRKGVLVSPHAFDQSIDRKRAWAGAFAAVVREAEIRCGVSEYLT